MTQDATPADWQKTACILCECNCGIEVLLEGRALTKIRGDKDHPNSQGYSCEKPLRLDRYQNGAHRIDSPLRRRPDGTFEEISWDTALDEIAARLAAVRDEHGGERIFFYGGGGQGNHLGGGYGRALFNGVGGKYMSNALGQEKTSEAYVDKHLYGAHTAGDFENSEVAVFIGKNPWQSHGMARARPTLKELARDPDRAIIVIDPRKSETAAMADHHLQIKPGTDVWCLGALDATLVQENLIASEWLNTHAVGVDEVLQLFRDIDITDYARRCGVPEDDIRAAARRIARAKSVATYEDLGIQQSPNSTVCSYLQKMLWVLTGNFAKPGGMHIHSWIFPLAGPWFPIERDEPVRFSGARRAVGLQSMRHGAAAMRAVFSRLDGHATSGKVAENVARSALHFFFPSVSVAAADPIARLAGNVDRDAEVTPVTGARIMAGLIPANSIADEILTDHPDRFRAMFIESSNPLHSLADSERFRQAMRSLDLTVVIDVALTETARAADYVLPAASQFEKYEASLFTLHFPHNTFQMRHPLMPPMPGTRSEPEIYAALMDRLDLVDPGIIASLTASARVGRSAYSLALFSTIEQKPELAGIVPYLVYRTLGATFAPGDEAQSLVWSFAHLAAIAQPDAVRRAGFTHDGEGQGEKLFEAIRDRREGVIFTEDRYSDAWSYIRHEDKKIHVAIPELMDELRLLDAEEPCYTSEEFPFILSAGERRAFTANVIIRDPEWRRRDKDGALRMSPQDAADLAVDTGDVVRLITETGIATTTVEISDMMQPGHVSLPNGMGVSYPGENGDTVVGVPLNTLTTVTRRDKFFGNPWHKNVPVRIELVDSSVTAEG
ncbi:molybdopterin-dependent oxidoreductase [Rhodococcus sp. SORGH_AS_0303]|uniref:molybdopterin-dependent oxidoreductase n=1 Tax=Rhodococcus sp. SORGH_AS_0303 TaxID=3041753 RepID=UPI002784B8BD|nr:molybdopterin-dependent oxidoreductase [Rhodococcus sp. SORGH_AS_0303]MDQ1203594.1 anaerobic selenocysteine-containing dehydrogenase [Rhodococcus sp. SORGH_AS_0303]